MRFSKQELHPVIFEKIADFSRKAMYQTAQNSELVRVVNKKSSLWVKDHGVGCALWVLAFPAIMGLFAIAAVKIGPGVAIICLFAMLFAWLVAAVVGHQKTKDKVSLEALETMQPVLELNESEKLYLDCFVEVQKCSLLDASQKQHWSMALRDALDRSIQLEKLKNDLRELSGGQNHHEIQDEITRISKLVDESADDLTKAAYSESLDLVNLRLHKANGASLQIDRTEAHLELTRQTFLRTKEMLKGLSIGERQTVQVDLEPLRANLNRVQEDAKLIMDAIEELNQA